MVSILFEKIKYELVQFQSFFIKLFLYLVNSVSLNFFLFSNEEFEVALSR